MKIIKVKCRDKDSQIKNISQVAKILGSSDFNMGDRVWISGNKLEVVDTFYHDGARALNNLVSAWLPNGVYGKYFKNEYGVEFNISNKKMEHNGIGKYKKITGENQGFVSITLMIK